MRFFFKWIWTLIFFISWKIFATCSPYMNSATINEAGKVGFIEIKLLNASITSTIYNTWSVQVCKNRGRRNICSGQLSLSSGSISNSVYITVPTSDIPSNQAFDILLIDGSGKTIDYLSVGYTVQYDSSCALTNDWSTSISNSHDYRRKPDGKGKWGNSGNGNSGGNTRGETNDDTVVADYFLIEHDGNGLTCAPESVSIRACSDASCTSFDNTVNTTVTMQVNGGSDQNITIVNGSSVSETFVYTDPNTPAVLSLTTPDHFCSDTSDNSTDCTVNFAEAGFLLNLDNHQSCSTTTNLTIQAVRLSDSGLECAPAYTGNQSVNFTFNYDNPSSGTELPTLGTFNIAEKAVSQSETVTFDSSGTANLPFYYPDAGIINIKVNDGASAGLTEASVTAVVYPAKLIVATSDANAECTSIDAITGTCSVFKAAGVPFNLDVTAACSDGTVNKNFKMDNIDLEVTTIAPNIGNSVSLGVESIDMIVGDKGSHNESNQTISEVGVFTITATPQKAYFGETVPTGISTNIGRFTPDHFEQTVVEHGALDAVCNSSTPFAYTGQMLISDATKGAISYLAPPKVELTAKNALTPSGTTKNYTETNYMKLVAAANFITPPTADSTIKGKDNAFLGLTANLFAGTVSFGSPLAAGVLHYELGEDNFVYPHNKNAEVNAQDNNIDFDINQTKFVDSDGIGINSPVNITDTSGINLRFGRAYLENTFGPETSDLPQPFSTQYLSASGSYIFNEQDDCTPFDPANITLTSGTLLKSFTGVNTSTGNLKNGKTRAMLLTAPGAGNQGNINVSYNIYDWLKYDWKNSGVYINPPAVATFGLYRGNDRIIYIREVFK